MRRAFVQTLHLGSVSLDANEAHHVRDVLRLANGEPIELFDAQGRRATAMLDRVDRDHVTAIVDRIDEHDLTRSITVASAVPKNERADWLVEKLSEVGVTKWIPLKTARSVVHPAGTSKFDRWKRIAVESAKQSRRPGVMEIAELVSIESLDFDGTVPIVLSTREGSKSLVSSLPNGAVLLLIGPEGGWTDAEIDQLREKGAIEASLTSTILRLETAAVVAAGVVASLGR
jgi:16S rRNA (uracil1498-N3)-methyltransferase